MSFEIRNRAIYEVSVMGADLSTGQAVDNVMHYRVSDPGLAYGTRIAGSSSSTLLGAFQAQWLGVLANISDHYVAGQYNLKEVLGHVGPNLVYGDIDFRLGSGLGDPGLITGETLPDFCTASVQKRSALAGRSRRGRLSLGPISEEDSENGALTDERLTALQAAMDGFLPFAGTGGGGVGNQAKMVVFSKTAAVLEPDGAFSDDVGLCVNVTAFVVNRNCGSLVSRKPRLNQLIDHDA
jgi:hypothetical protein